MCGGGRPPPPPRDDLRFSNTSGIRCASRSHNETKLKRLGITAATAIGWGQEEGMDEDTALWKEGVHVRSFTAAQKGKNILFER